MKASKILLPIALLALLAGCSGGGPGSGDPDDTDQVLPVAQERLTRIDFHDASNAPTGYNLEVYGEDGNWLREESYNAGGTLTNTMVFTIEGNRIVESTSTDAADPLDVRRTVYAYSDDGRIAGSTGYKGSGNTLDSSSVYTYEDGLLDKIVQNDAEGELEYTFSYSYASGRRTQTIVTDSAGDELARTAYFYDSDGRLARDEITYEGALYRINAFTWEDKPVNVDFWAYFVG